MGSASRRTRRRQVVVGASLVAGFVGVGVLAAGADGRVELAPEQGAPGTSYAVTVTCPDRPLVFQHNTQDARTQGTIAPFAAEDVSEVSPSTWLVQVTAGTTDAEHWATCGGERVGTGRFDAEAPHLWLEPRQEIVDLGREAQRLLQGTDCPEGTTADAEIRRATGEVDRTTATIDRYGDWSVPLPAPVGAAEMHIRASCGSVTYDPMRLTTTSATAPAEPPTPAPPAPSAPAARPRTGTPRYSG